MGTLVEFREKYPQYGDMSDADLATALHSNYYPDMDQGQFFSQIGFQPPEPGQTQAPWVADDGTLGFMSGVVKGSIASTLISPASHLRQNPPGVGITRAVERGVKRLQMTPAAITQSASATRIADASMSPEELAHSMFLEMSGYPEVPEGLDVGSIEKASDAMNDLLGPSAAQIFVIVYDIRLARAKYMRGEELDTSVTISRPATLKQVIERGVEAGVRLGELKQEIADIPMSPSADDFSKIYTEAPDTFMGALKAITSDPLGAAAFFGETASESIPVIGASATAGIITRSPSLSAIVMGSGAAGQEFGSSYVEFLAEQDVKLNTADDALRILKDEELLRLASRRGAIRALTIAAFEVLGQGIAAKTLFKGPVKDAAAKTVVQAATGGFGEASARAMAGQDMSAKEILAEAFGELSTAPIEIGAAMASGGGGGSATPPKTGQESPPTLSATGAKFRDKMIQRGQPDPFPPQSQPDATPPSDDPSSGGKIYERNVLGLIRQGESGNNYGRVWSGIAAVDAPPKPLTEMTINEVLAWQDSIDPKYNSEAAGAYQIMEDTLRGLVGEVGLTGNEMFDEAMQDRLAVELMRRRGLDKFMAGEITVDEFANNLAGEWAALPLVSGDKAGRSRYAGDGQNSAGFNVEEFLNVLNGGEYTPGQPTSGHGARGGGGSGSTQTQTADGGGVVVGDAHATEQAPESTTAEVVTVTPVVSKTPVPDVETAPVPEAAPQKPDPAPEKSTDTGEAGSVEAKAAEVEQAALQAEDSPSDGQKEAGNYKKGHVSIEGLDITIENAKGSVREGVEANGKKWAVKMPGHYGYIKRTNGNDGDQVDVYVGDAPESTSVVIVDQINPETGKFDEHKVILSVKDVEAARKLYFAGFSDGSGAQRMGGISKITMEQFKEWLSKGSQKKPFKPTSATDRQVIEEATSVMNAKDPLRKKGEWMDADLIGTNEDGSETEVKAGEAVKEIQRRMARARRLWKCLYA